MCEALITAYEVTGEQDDLDRTLSIAKALTVKYGDDAAVHSLLIRVTDEQAGTPDELRVAIDNEPTDT